MSEHQQSLTTLIKRLEAATSRLEDLASSSASSAAVSNNLSRNSVGGQPAAVSSQNNDAIVSGEVPPALAAYDELIEGPLKNFLELSKAVGGLVEDQVNFLLLVLYYIISFIYTVKFDIPDLFVPIENFSKIEYIKNKF
jgi:hypothetical protein